MTFRAWQELAPEAAARELHRRVRTTLAPAQQRAVLAQLATEDELAARFTAARRDSPLGGVPFFVKDIFDVAGLPTFAGSTFLPEVRGVPANHGAFARALVDRGAVLAGKTHTHEFAYGVTGENPNYGDCEHPRFPGRTTGGSSSGSAAAVAAGIVPLALGSDTGGSVRLPASFCGLFGFRLVPREPWISDAVALAPSYDTAGWFTANAADMLTALETLQGMRTFEHEPRGRYLELAGLDADVAVACRQAAQKIAPPAERAVRDELQQAFSGAVDTYNTTVSIEAWEAHRAWAERYRERYSPVVWQRLNRVHAVTPAQTEAADASTARIRQAWEHYFKDHDFLVMAASPAPAFTKAECTLENRMRVLAVMAPASIGVRPALTVPIALPSGLTTGLQIVLKEPRSAVSRWVLHKLH